VRAGEPAAPWLPAAGAWAASASAPPGGAGRPWWAEFQHSYSCERARETAAPCRAAADARAAPASAPPGKAGRGKGSAESQHSAKRAGETAAPCRPAAGARAAPASAPRAGRPYGGRRRG